VNRNVGLFLATLATSLLSVVGIASAQTTTAASEGISISPTYQQVTLNQGQTTQTFNVQLTNNQATAQTVDLSTADLNTFNTNGVLFVGSNPTDLQKRYELTPWMTLGLKQLTLQPNQSINEPVTINNEADLAPGGHYGAVLIQSAGSSGNGTQKNTIGINSIGTSLIFLTKVGGDTYHLSLTKVQSPHSIFNLPSTITLKFNNVGNTQVTPRGYITITDPTHKLVSKGVINTDSDIIFPSTSRYYTVKMDELGLPKEVGKFTVQVNFRFDGYEQYRSYKSSFYITTPLGLVFIIASVVVVAVMVFIAFYKYRKKAKKSKQSTKKPSDKPKSKKPIKKSAEKPTSLDIYKRR
jgi:hypothetical protein